MYEALVSFATKIISMFKGQVAEIDDPEIVEDLLAAKYIEEYSPQPSGGYDGRIRITYDEYSEFTGCLLESGTYDSILDALRTKKTANIIVYVQDVEGNIFYYNPSAVFTTVYLDDPCISVPYTSEYGDPLGISILPDNTVVPFD